MKKNIIITSVLISFFQLNAMNSVLIPYSEEQQAEITALTNECRFNAVKQRIEAINGDLDDSSLLERIRDAYDLLQTSMKTSKAKRVDIGIDHRVRNELRTIEVSHVHLLLKACEPLRERLEKIANRDGENQQEATLLVQQLYAPR